MGLVQIRKKQGKKNQKMPNFMWKKRGLYQNKEKR